MNVEAGHREGTDPASPAWPPELEELRAQAASCHLKAAWENVVKREAQTEPSPSAAGEPHVWRWNDLRSNVLRAADLLARSQRSEDPRLRGSGWERRAFFLSNPAFPDSGRTTPNLSVAVQCMLPGDVGPCHRHTATALRFVVEGRGAFTSVDGEPVYMESGDLMLTPAMTWHDNVHEGDRPIVWMDYLDIPLVARLNALLFEPYESVRHPLTKPPGASERSHATAHLRLRSSHPEPLGPLLIHRWEATAGALSTLRETQADEFDGVVIEFVDPRTGGSISPTLSASAVELPHGAHLKAHRHTSSVAYHVRSGTGASIVEGRRLEWREGDLFVVPGWQWHEHVNTSERERALLIAISDAPALAALSLYREQPHPAGRQSIGEAGHT